MNQLVATLLILALKQFLTIYVHFDEVSMEVMISVAFCCSYHGLYRRIFLSTTYLSDLSQTRPKKKKKSTNLLPCVCGATASFL